MLSTNFKVFTRFWLVPHVTQVLPKYVLALYLAGLDIQGTEENLMEEKDGLSLKKGSQEANLANCTPARQGHKVV